MRKEVIKMTNETDKLYTVFLNGIDSGGFVNSPTIALKFAKGLIKEKGDIIKSATIQVRDFGCPGAPLIETYDVLNHKLIG